MVNGIFHRSEKKIITMEQVKPTPKHQHLTLNIYEFQHHNFHILICKLSSFINGHNGDVRSRNCGAINFNLNVIIIVNQKSYEMQHFTQVEMLQKPTVKAANH